MAKEVVLEKVPLEKNLIFSTINYLVLFNIKILKEK